MARVRVLTIVFCVFIRGYVAAAVCICAYAAYVCAPMCALACFSALCFSLCFWDHNTGDGHNLRHHRPCGAARHRCDYAACADAACRCSVRFARSPLIALTFADVPAHTRRQESMHARANARTHTQHNTTRHNTTRHNATRHNATRHNTTQQL
jgi:hypothetical protein